MAFKNDDDGEQIDSALLERTEKLMEDAGLITDDEEQLEVIDDSQTDDSTVADDSTLEVQEDVELQAEDSDDTESATSEESDDSQDNGIIDAYYRAAVHQGWTPEEIQELYKHDPELAVKTCKKLYESTNKLSTEFATLGRAKLQQEQEANKSKVDAVKANVPVIDLKPLQEQYGEDSPLVQVMQALIPVITSKQETSNKNTETDTSSTNNAAMRQLVDSFFARPDIVVYDNFYGKGNDVNELTHKQFQNRYRVTTLADEILIGAEAMGRKMTEDEALEAAHLQVSEPVRETVIRRGIVKQIKKRSKSITLKPQTTAQNANTDGKVSQTELEQRTEARLSKLKWT